MWQPINEEFRSSGIIDDIAIETMRTIRGEIGIMLCSRTDKFKSFVIPCDLRVRVTA